MGTLEQHFETIRNNTVGNNYYFKTPYGEKKLIYADWIASGRLYGPIEDKIKNQFGPMVANTHSEASETGVSMTMAYHHAHHIIKQHVNAGPNDVIITVGSGMTGVVNKFQRILGLRIPDQVKEFCSGINIDENDRPVVFITHMEHHSNHTSWLETIADVVLLEPDDSLFVVPDQLEIELKKYANRKFKIGSFSAASNVTGAFTPYHQLARIMHRHGGVAFIDFAASAPYVKIDMHPERDPDAYLDAIFFSPHKFLGGPGSAGVLIFDKKLYKNQTPDQPGGGTVKWTNRWNEYFYLEDIEAREDGGTPAFLQTMRAALAIRLKEQMGCSKIHQREQELLTKAFSELQKINNLKILANNITDRLGVISYYVENVHHNLLVKLLNDRFGVQVRGGCSCAGTYGHFLLNVDKETSHAITQKINSGDLSEKPGWVRVSLHPSMTDYDLDTLLQAIKQTTENANRWRKDYIYDQAVGEFFHKDVPRLQPKDFDHWYKF